MFFRNEDGYWFIHNQYHTIFLLYEISKCFNKHFFFNLEVIYAYFRFLLTITIKYVSDLNNTELIAIVIDK